MITMTERAASKVKEIAAAESLDGQGLGACYWRGCSGFLTTLFEDKPTDMDEEFEERGR